MRYLKYIHYMPIKKLNDDEYRYNGIIRAYTDNKGNPFTGIGIVFEELYNFYLNGTCIKVGIQGSKKIVEKEFNKAVKKHIFK